MIFRWYQIDIRLVMRIQLIVLMVIVAAAAEITLSKDSLWVCNSPELSRDDAVVFVNSSSDSVRVDSMLFYADVFDTAGVIRFSFGGRYEVMWWEVIDAIIRERYLAMDTVGNSLYRFGYLDDDPVEQPPPFPVFPPEDSLIMRRFQIGRCFICSSLPAYPNYVTGTLYLYCSNAQVLQLRLYSCDLRTPPVKVTVTGTRYSGVRNGKKTQFLLNGRKIDAGVLPYCRLQVRHRIVSFSRP